MTSIYDQLESAEDKAELSVMMQRVRQNKDVISGAGFFNVDRPFVVTVGGVSWLMVTLRTCFFSRFWERSSRSLC